MRPSTYGSYKIILNLIMGKFSLKIFFLTIFIGGSFLLRAQPNTLYFMKGIPQTKDLNPARQGISDGFYFSMPLFSKIDLAANTNNWAYNDLIHWRIQADSLVIDLNKLKESLGRNNFVYESAALTVLEGGYKKGKNFYAVSLTDREFINVFFSKSLINLIQNGNYPVGQTYYSGNFGIGAQNYREFAFNYSHEVTKKLTIGGAAKLLFGLGAIQTNGINLSASSPANGEYLDVNATGRANISAPVNFNYSANGSIKSVNSLSNYTLSDYLTNFKNPGIAVDLGFTYRLNKKTELSMSIIDLGMIGWKSNVTRLTEQGHFLYKGINIVDGTQKPPVIPLFKTVINQLSDSIATAFRPGTIGNSFSTLLPTKIYFGIDYQLRNNISVSGLSRIRIIDNTVRTSLTASANALFLERLSLSASYSIMESTYDNLGLGIGIKVGSMQIYTAADNLFSPFYPSTAKNMNLRIGINFIFSEGDKKSSGSDGNSVYPNCHCPN